MKNDMAEIGNDVFGIVRKRYGNRVKAENVANCSEAIIHAVVSMIFHSMGLTPTEAVKAGDSTVRHLGEQVTEALKRATEQN